MTHESSREVLANTQRHSSSDKTLNATFIRLVRPHVLVQEATILIINYLNIKIYIFVYFTYLWGYKE